MTNFEELYDPALITRLENDVRTLLDEVHALKDLAHDLGRRHGKLTTELLNGTMFAPPLDANTFQKAAWIHDMLVYLCGDLDNSPIGELYQYPFRLHKDEP